MSQFALEAARAARSDPRLAATVSVSRQNEIFGDFAEFGDALFAVDTYAANHGAVTQAWRLAPLRRRLMARLRQDRTQAVIELMPHVWSSFLAPAVQAAGARYVTIVHDADAHPGDHRTGWAQMLLQRAAQRADRVLTLSGSVTDRLAAAGRIPREKLVTLFHPDLGYAPALAPQPPASGAPLRLLFMGRIMPYKGLPVFLDAVEILRARNIPVEIGVFGEGTLGPDAARLVSLGAEVVNRWLSDAEIGAVLPRFHAMVLSHTEASQSGVAATALGSGLPVIATPVGGLTEQISDGRTGLLARRADAPALAEAFMRLAGDPQLYRDICLNIAGDKERRSMARFVRDCVSAALPAPP